jgi:hypothetical protein
MSQALVHDVKRAMIIFNFNRSRSETSSGTFDFQTAFLFEPDGWTRRSSDANAIGTHNTKNASMLINGLPFI